MAGKSHSAWNGAGTWEERDVSKWAEDYLRKNLNTVTVDGGAIRITAVDKCQGEALITFPRGKKRAGYEYEITLKFEATIEGHGFKGKIELPYVCEDVDDHKYEMRYIISGAGSTMAKMQQHLSATLTPILKKIVVTFSEELLKQ